MNKTLLNLLAMLALASNMQAENRVVTYFKALFAKKEAPAPKIPTIWAGVVEINGTIGGFKDNLLKIKKFVDNKDIDCIIIFINSGGGNDADIIADYIYEIKKEKPVIAFVSCWAVSAAYWIASACTLTIAVESAEIGSIGGIKHYTNKDAYIDVKSGKYKAADFIDNDKALAEEFEIYTKNLVNSGAEIFFKRVALYRNLDKDFIRSLEAQIFMAPKALELGLIDQIGTLRDLLQKINSLISEKTNRTHQRIQFIDSDIKIITSFNL